MPVYAQAVRRGCGTRKKGGIYAEAGIALPGETGMPLEHFIVDPPLPVDPSAIGLSPLGMKLIEKDGAWHLWDWVGEHFYPDVAGFLEEVRQFGLSRGPIPKNLDFERLTFQSKVILVHRKAWIENVIPYHADRRMIAEMNWDTCPSPAQDLHPFDWAEMCAGLWWQDFDPQETKHEAIGDDTRLVTASMPSFTYVAAKAPKDHVPGYSPAIFASFPIGRLAVVNDPEGGTHNDALDSAAEAGIPTDLVED